VNEAIEDSVVVTVDETGTFEAVVKASEATVGDEPSSIELVAAAPALRVGDVTVTRDSETVATVGVTLENDGGVPIRNVSLEIRETGSQLALLGTTEVPADGASTLFATLDHTALDRSEPQQLIIAPDGSIANRAIAQRIRWTQLVRPRMAVEEVRFRCDDDLFIEVVVGNYGPGDGRGTLLVRDVSTDDVLNMTSVSVPPGASDSGSFETVQLATPELSRVI